MPIRKSVLTDAGRPAGFHVDNRNYGVVWKYMHDGWAKKFTEYSGGFSLPIFLGGDAWREYEKSGEFESGPLFAIIGILYSWMDADKWLFDGSQEDLVEFRKELLIYLGVEAGVEDVAALEEFLTSAAVWVRENCGCVPSQRTLGGAVRVMPGSALVSYDYILDTWLLVETVSGLDQDGACNSIISVASGLDFDGLLNASEQGQKNVNSACYVLLGALLMQDMRSEFSALFEKLSSGYMQAPVMTARLKEAASKDNVNIDDLRQFTKTHPVR